MIMLSPATQKTSADICCVCAAKIGDEEIFESAKELSKKFSTVKLTCGGKCGDIITLFPRRKKKPRSVGKSGVRPTKKAQR